MIDPLGLALLAGGTLLSAVGKAEQANAEHDSLIYQARQLREDAMLTEVRGRIQQRAHRKKTDQIVSSMVAAVAKGGVEMSGSTLRLMQENARELAMDAYWMRRETEISAGRLRAGARQRRSQAYDVSQAGSLSILSDVVSAVGSFAGMGGGAGKSNYNKGSGARKSGTLGAGGSYSKGIPRWAR